MAERDLYFDEYTDTYYEWDGRKFVPASVGTSMEPTEDDMEDIRRGHQQDIEDDKKKPQGGDDGPEGGEDGPEGGENGPTGPGGGGADGPEGGEQGPEGGEQGPTSPGGKGQGGERGPVSLGGDEGDDEGPTGDPGPIGQNIDGVADDIEDSIEDLKKLAELQKKGRSEEEAKAALERLKKIEAKLADMAKSKTIDTENIRARAASAERVRNRQRKEIKANTKSNKEYAESAKAIPSDGDIKAFMQNLNDFKKDLEGTKKVSTYERRSRRGLEQRNVVYPGKKKVTYSKKGKAPFIGVYFDQSGSWDADDVERGKKAITALEELQKRGKLKYELNFFANDVFEGGTKPEAAASQARDQGGTHAGAKMLDHIKSKGYNNVIVMTDYDFDWCGEIERYWLAKGRKLQLEGFWALYRKSRSRDLWNVIQAPNKHAYDI